jgi:hypothetical protein
VTAAFSPAMQTPVLLVIFKRPELTRRALAAIAAARPSKLLVAADGPRGAFEAAACAETRAVVDEFDWQCEVVRNFSDTNLGCGVRMYTAIDWAFSLAEEVIILEDDCVPHASFFRFCEELLARYRDDERVMHISGNNFVGPEPAAPYSYYFSKYTHAWGWASWRRAWRHFDWAMKAWPEAKAAGLLETWCSDPYERAYWNEIWERMHAGAPDVWDYQWNFACWRQSGLAVLPAFNLVSNEGCGVDATHTKDPSEFLGRPTFALDTIAHPPNVFRNAAADAITFDRNFGGAGLRVMDSPRARFRRRISPYLGPLRFMKRTLKRIAGTPSCVA